MHGSFVCWCLLVHSSCCCWYVLTLLLLLHSMRAVTSFCLLADVCRCCCSRTAVASNTSSMRTAEQQQGSRAKHKFIKRTSSLMPHIPGSQVTCAHCTLPQYVTMSVGPLGTTKSFHTTSEWPQRLVTFELFHQRDEKTWSNQHEDKDKDIHRAQDIGWFLCCKWLFLSEFTFNTYSHTPSLPDQDRAERELVFISS